MDAKTISGLWPRFKRFLKGFSDCFGRREPAKHLETYVRGQFSNLPRKSIEPIAYEFDTPPRTLQQFLSRAKWDEDRMRDRIQERVAAEHTHPQAVGIVDETSFVKKGKKTPGAQRQHCGTSGKTDNCAVTVHLACAGPDGFRALLDGELFLPQSWSDDRNRCREAGIPDDMVYRPKWRIALELLDRSVTNGVKLPWLTFAEEPSSTRPQGIEGQESLGQPGGQPGQVFAAVQEAALADVPCERKHQGADHLAGQIRGLPHQPRRSAGPALPADRRSQRPGPQRGQVLRIQRSAEDQAGRTAAGGILAVSHRALLRG